MKRVTLIQLPIPQLNFGRQTGNVPLGAACLKQAAGGIPAARIEIVPERIASYLSDSALVELLVSGSPDILGFTVYTWNLDRSLHIARQVKQRTGSKVVFGGPETTPDNERIDTGVVDFRVFGEGESMFCRLLQDPAFWTRGHARATAEGFFQSSPSPYLQGLLEPEIENMVLLETQRGCPHRCGYCYYNKSRTRMAFADEARVLDTIRWTLDRKIQEIYLLDPCLNARPGLKPLLGKIARINPGKTLSFVSEIRAEAVDEALGDLFSAAGFAWFEIGLQSTNPRALARMNRATDLDRFRKGALTLRERGILPRIDLILGLPGDDLKGFERSVDFILDHGLNQDVQVFPLSVLPGTDFRKKSPALGLRYETAPPYHVIETSGFSPEDMLQALDYAESRLDVVLYPLPYLDLSWPPAGGPAQATGDTAVRIGGEAYFSKLWIDRVRPLSELCLHARRLTYPYQLLIGENVRDPGYLGRLLCFLTSANPYTPLEVVFFEPGHLPNRKALLEAVRLVRPQYLDNDLRFLFPRPGNRSVLFTLVSRDPRPRFSGEMERQVYWWQRPGLPALADLESFLELDGVLIDTAASNAGIVAWQDRFADAAGDLPFISFSGLEHQKRWLLKTAPSDFTDIAFDYAGNAS